MNSFNVASMAAEVLGQAVKIPDFEALTITEKIIVLKTAVAVLEVQRAENPEAQG